MIYQPNYSEIGNWGRDRRNKSKKNQNSGVPKRFRVHLSYSSFICHKPWHCPTEVWFTLFVNPLKKSFPPKLAQLYCCIVLSHIIKFLTQKSLQIVKFKSLKRASHFLISVTL